MKKYKNVSLAVKKAVTQDRLVKILSFLFVFSVLSSPLIALGSGFGVTPPYVKNSELTRGSVYEQRILLTRGDPDFDLKAELTVNVPGAEDWITIEPGREILLPEGERRVPVVIRLEIPKKAEYGNYEGSIRVRTSVDDEDDRGSGSVTIALGAQINVDIDVTDKVIKEFEITRVRIGDFNEGRKVRWLDYPGKMRLAMDLKNIGNIPVAPDMVRVDIYDSQGEEFLERIEHTNEIEKINPFDSGRVLAELPSHLSPGSYQGKYSIYNEDEVVRSGSVSFNIRKKGTIEGDDGYGFSGLSLWHKTTLIGPFVLLFFIILSLVMYFSPRTRGMIVRSPSRLRSGLRRFFGRFSRRRVKGLEEK